MFVTAPDFDIPPYNIPNLNKFGSTFTQFVDGQERDLLTKVLGYPLYEAFMEGLAQPEPDDKWVALRDGGTFQMWGKTYRWKGFKAVFVPYIYAQWLTVRSDSDTGIGVVVSDAENSTVVSPGRRIADAWNNAMDVIGAGWWSEYCRHYRLYPVSGDMNNLFLFLYNSGTTYTTPLTEYSGINMYLYYNFDFPGFKNIFDI